LLPWFKFRLTTAPILKRSKNDWYDGYPEKPYQIDWRHVKSFLFFIWL
jgi:hypothetical protein